MEGNRKGGGEERGKGNEGIESNTEKGKGKVVRNEGKGRKE